MLMLLVFEGINSHIVKYTEWSVKFCHIGYVNKEWQIKVPGLPPENNWPISGDQWILGHH